MMFKQLALLLVFLSMLSGCSTMSDWVGDNDQNAIKPVALTEIKTEITVNTLWSRDIGQGAEGYPLTPSVMDGRVFVAGHGGLVRALDAVNGNSIWQQDVEAFISGGTGVGDGIVVVGTKEAEVIALKLEDGSPAWRTRVSSVVMTSPVISQDIVVVRTIDGKLFGLDAGSGKRLWVFSQGVPVLSLHGNSAPVLAGDAVLAGFDSGRLVALDLRNGRTFWSQRISVPSGRSDLERMIDIDASPVVKGKKVYVVNYQGRVAALELYSGRIDWKRDMSSHVGLGVDERNLYISDEVSHLWALDRFNSSSIWRQEGLYGRQATAPTPIGAYVVSGDYEGYLHWMDNTDGHFVARQKLNAGRIIAAPVNSDGVIYVYGSNGTLTALKPAG